MRRLAFALATLACALVPATASAATLNATPSTFPDVFASAQAGDIIELASGDYGTFKGGMKSGEVVIREGDGASATMALHFRPAANITIDGLKITDAQIGDSRTNGITIRNSDFDGAQIVFRTGELGNSGILLEGNRHTNMNVCSGCYAGRISLVERRTDVPSGITIRNSYFAGGSMDGILNGSNGTRIVDNEFTNLQQITDGSIAHTDSIQLYGSRGTIVERNYFHDVAVGIMCADGCEQEIIQDNIFAVNGSPYAVQLLSDNGSRIVHNTFLDYGLCDYNLRCGVLYLGNKSVDPPSQGTVLKDNIITRACLCSGTEMGLAEEGYNLFTQESLGALTDMLATPIYVGGDNPSTRDGFRLADGSPGKGSASDGLDRGVRFDTTTEPAPEPTPEPTPAACEDGTDNDGDGHIDYPADPGCTDLADTDEADPTTTLDPPAASYVYSPTSPTTGQEITFDGTGSTCPDTPCTYRWEDDGPDGPGGDQWLLGTGEILKFTFSGAGEKYVRLIVTDEQNRSDSTVKTVTVTEPAAAPVARAPTLIDKVASSWGRASTASKTTPSTSVQAADVLVALAGSEDYSAPVGKPSGGSLTWTEQQRIGVAAWAPTAIATATVDAAKSMGVSASGTSRKAYGIGALAFRGSSGIGASSKATVTGAPALSITTQASNSALVVFVIDRKALDGASRAWRALDGAAPTEVAYAHVSGRYTVYAAVYAAGAAGDKTVGLSAPASMKASISAVEVKPS